MVFEIVEDIDRPPRKVVLKFRKYQTAIISDALGKFGAMSGEIKPLFNFARIAGPAVTVKLHVPDCLLCLKSISVAKAGDVIVIGANGNKERAVWGDLTSRNSLRKHLAGVIIDGAARDLQEMIRTGFPIFCRAITPAAGAAEYLGEINTKIQCGGVNVSPGDIIVGDSDGVVVVPQERIDETLRLSALIEEAEDSIAAGISQGEDIGDMLRADQRIKDKVNKFIPQFEKT